MIIFRKKSSPRSELSFVRSSTSASFGRGTPDLAASLGTESVYRPLFAAESIEELRKSMARDFDDGKLNASSTLILLRAFFSKLDHVKKKRLLKFLFQKVHKESRDDIGSTRGGWIGRVPLASSILKIAIAMDPANIVGGKADLHQKIKNILKGKKILVLGDDRGSLCQTLRLCFNCEAHGLEIHPEKVLLAHSGAVAKDGKPLEYVHHGDFWDLCIEDSSLSATIRQYAPFDAIVSKYLFNFGSRGEFPNCFDLDSNPDLQTRNRSNYDLAPANPEDFLKALNIKRHQIPYDPFYRCHFFFEQWLIASRSLLSPDGIQAHLESDYNPLRNDDHFNSTFIPGTKGDSEGGLRSVEKNWLCSYPQPY